MTRSTSCHSASWRFAWQLGALAALLGACGAELDVDVADAGDSLAARRGAWCDVAPDPVPVGTSYTLAAGQLTAASAARVDVILGNVSLSRTTETDASGALTLDLTATTAGAGSVTVLVSVHGRLRAQARCTFAAVASPDVCGDQQCTGAENEATCPADCTPPVCAEVTCSGHGTCVASSGVAACQCDPGYVAVGLSCDAPVADCAGWESRDLGVTALTGSATCADGAVRVRGSGADIWGTVDAFRFTYQPLTGDGSIVARVASLTEPNAWAKAGVMMRASLDANAAHAHALVSASALNPVKFDRRLTAGGTTTGIAGTLVAAPYWVRVDRQGDRFRGYQSTDGVAWQLLGEHTVVMPATVFVGLSVTAHDNSQLAEAVFEQVEISQAIAPECGDGACSSDEDCASCADDCGTCTATCAPGTCAGDGLRAFPGAEGGGAESVGGRGGAVLEVTNLNDSGPGSLRAACLAAGPRTVVFKVAGTIDLRSEITITNPYLTIAGQTAPGGGILLMGKNLATGNSPLMIQTHDVTIRYLRIRLGANTLLPDQTGDCLAIRGATGQQVERIIIDHCSFSWSLDENFEVWSQGAHIKKVTFSWIVSAEGLYAHSKGAIIGSHVAAARPEMTQLDLHHNFFMSNRARSPYMGAQDQTVINNLVYNWGNEAGIMARGGLDIDIIGNICRTGPQSDHDAEPDDIQWYPWAGSSCEQDTYCLQGAPSILAQGNVGDNHANPDLDNWHMLTGWDTTNGTYALPTSYQRTIPLSTTNPRAFPITVEHALNDDLEARLLTDVGASRRLDELGRWVPARDAVDARLVAECRAGQGQIPVTEADVGGFPTIASGVAYPDTDHDGMADAWERARGLDPSNAADRNATTLSPAGYTNLELFLAGATF